MYLESSEMFWLIAAVVVYAIVMHVRIGQWKQRAHFVQDTDKYRDGVEARLRERDAETRKGETQLAQQRAKLSSDTAHLKMILDRTARVYPWAAKIYGDVLEVEANGLTRDLQAKRHPAFKAAEEVQGFKRTMREQLQRAKFAEYKTFVYESAFPFLVDLIEGAPTTDLAVTTEPRSGDDDPARPFLTDAEYARLSPTARSQLALERYVERRKSNWEIGRDYERYIGHQYEKLGWEVEYFGATQRLEDLGRDLIAHRNGQTIIVQCKYWNQWTPVRENAVFQLFGSVVDYLFEHKLIRSGEDVLEALKRNGVRGLFVTSTNMSERALAASKALGIEVNAGIPFDPKYPRIKCNVGRTEKLYHLPFDQQYDRIKIEPSKGEFYAATAAEAEAAGFRRVYRWRPQAGEA